MPDSSFDVIIVGLGAMGSAAAYHLAKSGRKVLGLDRFRPPHTQGSSHGQTRIIREAYFEDPAYVPLVQRAYELWAELEQQSGRILLKKTGGLMIGPASGVVFSGAKRSAEQHRLAHEILTAADVRGRFPVLQPEDSMSAVWEPRAGILFPESCIEAHLQLARTRGATLQYDEPVQRWEADHPVRVITSKGSYSAEQLLFCAGAWTGELFRDLGLPLRVERQVQFWFEPAAKAASFEPDKCPIHIWEFERDRFFYGFPDLGEGVKVAAHHEGVSTLPDNVDRTVREDEVDRMRQVLKRFVPDANGRLRSTAVCMYTNTPDGHFVIDHHPKCPEVLMASPCSGHGFKFSSAIGEVLADLLWTGQSRFDLKLFQLKRLQATTVELKH
jgi:sarcosine oxidase